jgi:hypothetical protein
MSDPTPKRRLAILPRTATGAVIHRAVVDVSPMTRDSGSAVSLTRQGNDWVAEVPTRTRLAVTVSGQDGQGPFFEQRTGLSIDDDGHPWFDGNYPDDYPDVQMRLQSSVTGADAELRVVLPRVRDVTSKEKTFGDNLSQSNGNWTASKPGPMPVPTIANLTTALDNVWELDFISSNPIDPVPAVVFEIAHLSMPKLVAVAAPRNGASFNFRDFLVYYHHAIGQNVGKIVDPFTFPIYSGDTYPDGPSYMFFGFDKYLYYNGGRGLAYQLAASRRNVALVLAMPNRTTSLDKKGRPHEGVGGVGRFTDPLVVEEVLLEILGHFMRRNLDFGIPRINSVGVASYSEGSIFARALLNGGGRLQSLIREVYDFDGQFASGGAVTLGGATRTRLDRSYIQNGDRSSFVRAAQRFQYQLPWQRWVKRNPPPPGPSADKKRPDKDRQSYVHGIVASYMLLHALSLSTNFPSL